ncbi:MAG: DUF2924 domain-containing protein [Alphaproteobacteria bacterium]
MNISEIKALSIDDLRRIWEDAWGYEPHTRLGRRMMEESLACKLQSQQNNPLSAEQQKHLDKLVAEYKSSPARFDSHINHLKPGTRLVRVYNGKTHNVLVLKDGFEYDGQNYNSLSKIANEITGSKWNGWLFFQLKKQY